MTAPRPTARRARHRLRSALTERLPLKATAVFLAFLLWVITSTREETEELLPVRFTPGLDNSLELVGEPPQVRVLVRGLGREVLKLHQSPPVVRRTLAGDLPDTITIELRPADVDLPPAVDARVLDVRPRTVTLVFKPIISRSVPVRSGLLVRPDHLGRVAAGLYFEPESVTVSGRRQGVARLRAMRTVTDTIPAREGVTHTVRLDTAGLRAIGVRVRPATVRVRVSRLARAVDAYGETEPDRAELAPSILPAPPPPTPVDSPSRGDTARPAAPRDSTVRPPPAARDSAAPRKIP